MDLSQNYYHLFGLPQVFVVDQNVLANKYRELQREFHPDKFASKSAAEQRMSVQFTSLLNSAYQTLKSPLLSAEYLLELSNHPMQSDAMTIEDNAFLFKQMDWREQLADLSVALNSDSGNSSKHLLLLEDLRLEVSSERQSLIELFQQFYNNQNFEQAIQAVAKLHFVEKMLVNIDNLEDDLIV